MDKNLDYTMKFEGISEEKHGYGSNSADSHADEGYITAFGQPAAAR